MESRDRRACWRWRFGANNATQEVLSQIAEARDEEAAVQARVARARADEVSLLARITAAQEKEAALQARIAKALNEEAEVLGRINAAKEQATSLRLKVRELREEEADADIRLATVEAKEKVIRDNLDANSVHSSSQGHGNSVHSSSQGNQVRSSCEYRSASADSSSPSFISRSPSEVQACKARALEQKERAEAQLAKAREKFGEDLGFTGVKQQGYGPEMWGVTLAQLKDITKHPAYKNPENWSYQSSRRDHTTGMTMRDVVTEIVKPMTMGLGQGYALLKNMPHPLQASVMVSHAWDENYHDFLDAIISSQNKGPFWVCALAIYQPEDIPELQVVRQLGSDPTTGPFATVLKQAVLMLAVVTQSCNMYTRMWCIYEMFTALDIGVAVEVARNSVAISNMGGDLDDPLVNQSFSPVNCDAARCGPPSSPVNDDERAIRRAIEETPGGYEAVDAAIEKARFGALLRSRPGGLRYCNPKTAANVEIDYKESLYDIGEQRLGWDSLKAVLEAHVQDSMLKGIFFPGFAEELLIEMHPETVVLTDEQKDEVISWRRQRVDDAHARYKNIARDGLEKRGCPPDVSESPSSAGSFVQNMRDKYQNLTMGPGAAMTLDEMLLARQSRFFEGDLNSSAYSAHSNQVCDARESNDCEQIPSSCGSVAERYFARALHGDGNKLAHRVSGLVQINLGAESSWLLVFHPDGPPRLTKGDASGNQDSIIAMTVPVFLRLQTGELTVTEAISTSLLEVHGDRDIAWEVADFFFTF